MLSDTAEIDRHTIFIPALALLYAGMLATPAPLGLGHPFSGTALIGAFAFSVIVSDEVPLAMKSSRGLLDRNNRGAKVDVMI